ncbi:MAG: hypothetical protein HQL05_04795 [Nitrospirae bacterium]|uniref:hypothetical protein n=1 Tax=Candidatus Magnetobacterium casense TaxID=1455061 RepID=UPI00058C08DE|nr:hypothetical protein [Candidatus Magnetobacterium casensis]MBF0337131.1 hypothetical protein [Nitrospirota bacterium]
MYDKSILERWLRIAETFRKRLGNEVAISYIVGEKFYFVSCDVLSYRKLVTIYNMLGTVDDEEECMNIFLEGERLLAKFADMITSYYDIDEINQYLDSSPELGAIGRIRLEDGDEFLQRYIGDYTRPLAVEVENIFILEEMKKYFSTA